MGNTTYCGYAENILIITYTDWSVVDIFQGEIKYREPTNSTSLHSDIRNVEFITFGIVLIVWEVLPTFMFVWFFRVRRPNVGDMVS